MTADDEHGSKRFAFGDFVVDLDARLIDRAGTPISIEPQVFDVLAVLIAHRHRVVTKLELFDTVWGDRFVSPASLTSRIRDLRAALGDTGRAQRVIRTAHGRGFQFVAEIDEVDERSAGVPTADRTDAPGPIKPLIGRAGELAQVREWLGSSRLVTLIGPGGIGKTHLMRHVVADTDAIVCELADVRDPGTLARTVLATVGGTELPDSESTDAITQLLRGRQALLVLDNCEHVIDDAIALIVHLLAQCRDLTILATSRRPLLVADESAIRLRPLDREAAIGLMVDRAARHGVTLDPSDRTIDQVCDRLDRLPLAIELAASKTRALPLDDLRRLLDDRFDLLTSDVHDAAEHHRSLDATIAWSVDLLTETQRRLFARLSVFVGPFDLSAVSAVCRAEEESETGLLADLMALVDLSLVSLDPHDGRYRMLESIRMFADGLGVDAATRDRHREHVITILERSGAMPAATFTPDLHAIVTAWPNVRAVVDSAIRAGDSTTLHRIITAVTRYAEQTFAFEVLDWVDAAIELDERQDLSTPGSTHLAAALLLTHRSDFERAERHLPQFDGADPALAALTRLWHRYFTGDLVGADRAAAEIRSLDGGTGSYAETAAAVGTHFLDKGAQRSVDPELIARLDTLAAHGDDGVGAGAALCAAVRLDWEDDADLAIEQLTEIVERARRLGLAFVASGATTARSIVLAISPDAHASARGLRSALRSYVETGSWQFALADFGATALTLVRHGRPRDAAELLGARLAAGYVGDSSNEVAEQAAEAARSELGRRSFDAACRQGAARDAPTATRLAVAALDQVIDGTP